MNHEKNENENASKECSTGRLLDGPLETARSGAVARILGNPEISAWARTYWSAVLLQLDEGKH